MRDHGIGRRALLSGVVSVAAAGCVDVGVETTYRRSVEASYGVAVDSLALAVPRGDVTVRGTTDDEVTLSGALVGERQAAVAETAIVGDHADGHLTLAARRDGRTVDDVDVALTLRVPDDTRVTRVAVDRGRVGVERVAGPLVVRARRGDVSVADVAGGVSVSLSEGEVSVADVDGDVVVTGVDGDVSVTGVDGDVRAEAGVGFVGVSDVTGNVTAAVESGDTDIVDVDGRVSTAHGGARATDREGGGSDATDDGSTA